MVLEEVPGGCPICGGSPGACSPIQNGPSLLIDNGEEIIAVGTIIQRESDRRAALSQGSVVVGERVYLDADGKATTDEAKGQSLWATEGTEVTKDEAEKVGYKAARGKSEKVETNSAKTGEAETSYRDLQARAKELGLSASGSREELEEAIASAEANGDDGDDGDSA